jgi:hypothetical protein
LRQHGIQESDISAFEQAIKTDEGVPEIMAKKHGHR